MLRRCAAALDAEEMEPGIWGKLPDDLLDRILALLPLSSLVALRPTCRRFRSLLLCPSFLSLLLSSSPPSPSSFLLLSHPQFYPRFLPLYSSSSASWRPLALPLPTRSALLSSLLSSSSGLLLLSPRTSSPHLLVSNPLTNSSKLLLSPAYPVLSATLVSLPSPSPSPHGYKIFLLDSSSNSVFLYDSFSASWSKLPGFARANPDQTPVLFDGSLYFVNPEPFSIVTFRLASGSWEAMLADIPDDLAFARLVGDGGRRLFLVGGVGNDGISRIVRVWEMAAGGAWEEVGRLPEMMCRKLVSVCYHNYAHVHCLWLDGMVCVCCTTWPEVLVYRVARRTWHWLPKCPLLQEKWSCGFRWFSFVPDLCALV